MLRPPILAPLLCVLTLLLAVPAAVGAQPATPTAPTPPTQPTTGPCGMDYAFDRVVASEHGEGPTYYWIFAPAAPRSDGTPSVPQALPLVLFFSGCCAPDTPGTSPEPVIHRSWIDHLVRRGAVVVYPIYREASGRADAIGSVREAMAELEGGGYPPVDPARVATVGWSLGGGLAVDYAVLAAAEGLPAPAAVMLMMSDFPLADLGAVPATTRVLVVVGSNDESRVELDARRIWEGLTAVPPEQRDYVVLASDDRGSPPLVADHFVPMTDDFGQPRALLDALDWYGTWKLLDALMACSFDGTWCEHALGDTHEQRFMGVWSDGVPVIELDVTDDPGRP